MANRKLPAHIKGTIHQWRVQKRRELRQALERLQQLKLGCAYTPACDEINLALAFLKKAKDLMSPENWGK